MAKVDFTGFRGVMPRVNPTMLDQNVAQTAHNCVLWHKDVRSLRNPTDVVTPVPRGGELKTIYRIGQNLGETQYWMAWTGDVDVVRGIVADDPNERTYYTGDGYPKATTLPMATQGGTTYPVNAYRLGVPRPAAAPSGTITRFPGVFTGSGGLTFTSTAVYESRVYVYTYVNSLGEEGAISPPFSISAPTDCDLSMTGLSAAPSGNYNIVSKRLYRSVTIGANQGAFFFEAEIPVAQTTYVSVAQSTDLNEELTTADYDAPPDSMTGIIALPNGLFAAFDGYDVYFCEPNHPYAWPAKYRQTMDYPVVGLGTFGASLVVLTKGSPYIINGTHPDSMTAEKVELDQACVSKRSIVSMGGGVIYASPDGLMYVGAGGSRILTEGWFTRDKWQALSPSGIDGSWTDGKYIGFHATGGFIMNSLEDSEFVTFDDTASGTYVDKVNDTLFMVKNGVIRKFNAGAAKTFTWRGRKVLANLRPAPKCAKVEATAYPVTMKLFADGVLKHTQSVASSAVFRLPNGYRARHLEIELSGTQPITYAGMADTPEEFRNG